MSSLVLISVLLLLSFHSSNAQPNPGYYLSNQFKPSQFYRAFLNLWGPQHQTVTRDQSSTTIWLDRTSGHQLYMLLVYLFCRSFCSWKMYWSNFVQEVDLSRDTRIWVDILGLQLSFSRATPLAWSLHFMYVQSKLNINTFHMSLISDVILSINDFKNYIFSLLLLF